MKSQGISYCLESGNPDYCIFNFVQKFNGRPVKVEISRSVTPYPYNSNARGRGTPRGGGNVPTRGGLAGRGAFSGIVSVPPPFEQQSPGVGSMRGRGKLDFYVVKN